MPVPGFLLAAAVGLLAVAPADAQVGLGAERYEVTITPPKRPGSEPAAEAASPDAAGDTGAAGAGEGADAPAGDAAATNASAAPAAPAARAEANPDLPLRTLQVGAFRAHDSAEGLRDALAASFQDVTILEVQSGGEALYRVNVGRLPKGPALDDLRRRLVAAGHPAFEVPAPK